MDIHVSRAAGSLRIVDNCRGMAPEVLSSVVMRVGESRKRGASFVNGQFGFGMQSFRAACSTLTVTSRAAADPDAPAVGASAYRIRVEREQSDGFVLERLQETEAEMEAEVEAEIEAEVEGAFEGRQTDTMPRPCSPSGTEVVLAGFDR